MTASERPHDTGGPRPENQRKRAELTRPRRSLIAVLAFVALAALAFAVLRRADDHFLGLPPGFLAGMPALVVAVLIAGTQVLAAVLLASHVPRARVVAAIAAGLVIASGVGLIMSMLAVTWPAAVLCCVGFIELLLVAGSTPRKPGRRKHLPGH